MQNKIKNTKNTNYGNIKNYKVKMAGGQYKDGKLEVNKYLNLPFIPEHAHAQSFEISWLKSSTLKQNLYILKFIHKKYFQSELETSRIFQNIFIISSSFL